MRSTGRVLSCILVAYFFGSFTPFLVAQGSYKAQLRGVVSDASGAVVHDATVTITDTGTNISSAAHSDVKGEYYFTGLRPSTYSVKAQVPGFRTVERTGVVLAVDQEATLNFTLTPAGVSQQIEVTTAAPLLDTESATLGTDITGEYVKELPLLNRDFFGLTFLAGGVTEAAGSGTQDNYPTGTNFVDLPVGRKEMIGGNMNRALDAVVGGWSIATLITEQAGQPMAISDAFGRLANGTQRPNVVCSQLKSGSSMRDVALSWESATPLSYFNSSCFADPGDQNPGNAPRYFPGLRVDGIHNVDLNLYKSFEPKEGMKLEVRAEIFNLANHPRFAAPNTAFAETGFGTITSDAAGYLPRYFQFGLRFEF